MNRRVLSTFILLSVLLLAGCAVVERLTPTRSATPTPATVDTAIPQATEEPQPAPATETALPPAETAQEPAGNRPQLPEPQLFDLDWADDEIYRSGLIDSAAERALALLPEASVYHLDLALSETFTQLEGVQEVRYTNRESVALDEVYFRLFPNLAGGRTVVSSLSVNGQPVTPGYELADSAMRVPLTPALQPGESVVFALAFTVDVPEEGGGNYGTFVFSEDILALAHFYPMIAVFDDEGWNIEIAPESGDVVYADSSFYVVRVTAPRGLQLVGSGVAVAREERDQQQVVTYAAGPARDFYLAASEGFDVVTAQAGETTVNSYTFPELEPASRDVLEYAVASLQSFNENIGLYPYSEFDVVSTPTLALGVEYPGVVAINKEMYDPSASRFPAGFLESTVAHEVGHQWFYAVVGNDQLDDPWLDESLVQYITMKYFEDVHGPAAAAGFRRSLEQRWAAVNEADMPIGLPVAAYEGPEYSGIVYGRGPLFFETLAQTMGQETYDAFLRDYYEHYTWDIATPEGLHDLAEVHCECELDSLFDEWVYE
ncbi:MAG TPA: M1 family metallopeptidase [Candidatus Sulfomarinibacteraceae bacterium]|nr:M1 family metallopeptidase [Candidatus Sulfomarinibacteraceae bacterium]